MHPSNSTKWVELLNLIVALKQKNFAEAIGGFLIDGEEKIEGEIFPSEGFSLANMLLSSFEPRKHEMSK